MVQYKNNSRKNLAMSLRRGGHSYSEIRDFVSVPKATLNYWFRELKLSEPQLERLKKKRSEAAKLGMKNRSENVARMIAQIQKNSAKDIGKISKRELWLMGVMLYWKKIDVRKGVQFMSTDPHLLKLFLKWLKEVGQLEDREIEFDLFLGKKNKAQAIQFWSQTIAPPGHVYKHNNTSQFGILQIRVKASSMLARQMSGWIKGIQDIIKH